MDIESNLILKTTNNTNMSNIYKYLKIFLITPKLLFLSIQICNVPRHYFQVKVNSIAIQET